MTHSYYADMGGFFGYLEPENSVELEAFITPEDFIIKTRHTRRNIVVFNTRRLIEHRMKNSIQKLPSISLLEIEGKSKEDTFVKGGATVQVLWLIF